MSERYRPDASPTDAFGHDIASYRRWLQPLFDELPAGSPVLDLGCGSGVPAGALLAAQFSLTGVDVSEVQIERARRTVPTGTFVRADMTEVSFPDRSFAAVVALYSLIHVPRAEQPALLRRIRRWLRPAGRLVAIVGWAAWEGIEPDWLGSGTPMFWSHPDVRTFRAWLDEAEFTVTAEEFVPEATGGHALLSATVR